MCQSPLTILSLDQSTHATGVVVIRCCGETIEVVDKATLTSTVQGVSLRARAARLREMRRGLAAFIGVNPRPDLIVYEQPFTSTTHSANWDALPMALGAFLTLSGLASIDIVPIMRQAACSVAGAGGLYRESTKTAREKELKRRRLKAAVIVWARQYLPDLADDDDAIADALACAVAAYRNHQTAETKKQNAIQPLFGEGSRAKRTGKGTKANAV